MIFLNVVLFHYYISRVKYKTEIKVSTANLNSYINIYINISLKLYDHLII